MPLLWAPQHHMLIFNDEVTMSEGFPGGSVVRNLPVSAGDMGLIPGLERSPGEEERNGNPVQYSCLENPMDRGAWRSTVHGVAKSQTQLSMPITTADILKHLICSKHYSQCFLSIILFNPATKPYSEHFYYYLHFTKDETGTQRS